MTIAMTCSCGQFCLYPDEFAGKHTKCLACGTQVLVPGSKEDSRDSEPETYALVHPSDDSSSVSATRVGSHGDAILAERSQNTLTFFREYHTWQKAVEEADKRGSYHGMDAGDFFSILSSMPLAAFNMGSGYEASEKRLDNNRQAKRQAYLRSLPGYTAAQELKERGYPVTSPATMKTLSRHLRSDDLTGLALLARRSSDKVLRQGAVVALADAAGAAESRVSLIFDCFSDIDSSIVWCWAARPLATLVTAVPDTLHILVDVADDHRSPKARYAAMYALRLLGPVAEPAIEFIIRSVEDPDSDVRDAAIRTLCSVGPAAVPAIPRVICAMLSSDLDHLDRLSKIEDPQERILPALYAALDNSSDDIKLRSMKAIGIFGKSARPAIQMLSQLCASPRRDVAKTAYRTLMAIDGIAALLYGGREATVARISLACFVVTCCGIIGYLIWHS